MGGPLEMATVKQLEARVAELEKKLEQVDLQSRCAGHFWAPSDENAREWVCSTCGAVDTRRH